MKPIIWEWALWLEGWVEASIAVKSTILLAAGLVAAGAAQRARASVRHLLLAATFGALLVLPIMTIYGPRQTVEVSIQKTGSLTPKGSAPALETAASRSEQPGQMIQKAEAGEWAFPSGRSIVQAGRALWIIGVIGLLISLLADLARLRRVRRDGLPCPEWRGLVSEIALRAGVRRQVEVLRHEWAASPLTCGVRRPVIILPVDAGRWSEEDLSRAMTHEMEHIRRSDWAVQMAVRAISAIYWFHPLIWVASRRLRLEAERACDDAVVLGAEPAAYADQLVSLAERFSRATAGQAIGMAHRSDLAARVASLLDREQPRGRAGFAVSALALGVAGFSVLFLAPVRTAAAGSASLATAQPIIQGTDGNAQDRRGRRALDEALYEAAQAGEIAEIEEMLSAGANVNAALSGDGSPLIGAARKGRVDAVRLLLERGADVNLGVTGDGNPLITASREGRVEVVRLLLDRGANIEQVVDGDENALIQASGSGRLETVKLLVERGADVNSRVFAERLINRPEGEFRTPLSMARRGNHQTVVEFLLAAGARE